MTVYAYCGGNTVNATDPMGLRLMLVFQWAEFCGVPVASIPPDDGFRTVDIDDAFIAALEQDRRARLKAGLSGAGAVGEGVPELRADRRTSDQRRRDELAAAAASEAARTAQIRREEQFETNKVFASDLGCPLPPQNPALDRVANLNRRLIGEAVLFGQAANCLTAVAPRVAAALPPPVREAVGRILSSQGVQQTAWGAGAGLVAAEGVDAAYRLSQGDEGAIEDLGMAIFHAGLLWGLKPTAIDRRTAAQAKLGGGIVDGEEASSLALEKWSVDHLSPAEKARVESFVASKLRAFEAADGTIERVSQPYIRATSTSTAHGFKAEALGRGELSYRGGKPVIRLSGSANLGTEAEELVHWMRHENGLPGHPGVVLPGETRPVDPVRHVMESWGFKRVPAK